jgi:DNA-binding XRE family transcriptional regulator
MDALVMVGDFGTIVPFGQALPLDTRVTRVYDVTMSGTLVPVWTIGDRLRKSREMAGYTTEEMAELLGCGRRSLVRWENGAIPKRMVITAWAHHTRVPLEWFEEGLESLPTGRYDGIIWLEVAA